MRPPPLAVAARLVLAAGLGAFAVAAMLAIGDLSDRIERQDEAIRALGASVTVIEGRIGWGVEE